MLQRIHSIDILRGIAMVLMALDHTRDYFHQDHGIADPLDLETTTPILFFTRWITHLCAPIFIFLSGTSIYLQSKRKSPKELSMFVIKRGLWLIIAEWTIIAFAWTFNPTFNLIPFQVIWAIGISMVLLGVLLRLQIKPWVLLLVGLAIILGHNSLDGIESGFKALPPFWWDFLHYGSFTPRPLFSGITVLIAYPFLPWTALMMCGYALGKWYEADVSPLIRRKRLIITGSGLILFFIALRSLNSYGDPLP